MLPFITESDLSLTEEQFLRVSDAIYNHCGINLHDGKKTLVRARLAKRLRQSDFRNVSDYIDFALSAEGNKEFHSLVDSISTNLTSFFREKVHFDYLKNNFLPQLLSSGKNSILVWSAGCSSGEEPYSLAITLLEATEGYGGGDIKILATDVSREILDRARHGTYDKNRVSPLNPQQRQQYLVPNVIEGHKVYQVKNNLRSLIRFKYLNLMEQWPFRGPFDVIFCRNVMIYFDKPTQEKLTNRFYDCLGQGGLLCIGHSESLTGINHKYRYVFPATYLKP